METKDLTEKEQAFLDFLFDGEEIRSPIEAKRLAGYPADYPVTKIVNNVQKQLLERCDNYLALHAPNGVVGLIQLLNEPETPGMKLKLQTIIEILDRAGVVKKEKVEVAQQAPSFMFILPQKADISNT